MINASSKEISVIRTKMDFIEMLSASYKEMTLYTLIRNKYPLYVIDLHLKGLIYALNHKSNALGSKYTFHKYGEIGCCFFKNHLRLKAKNQ